MNLKKRGFGGIEVILVILILLVGFFLAIPIVNTFFKSHHPSNIIHHEQELENWNAGMEKNIELRQRVSSEIKTTFASSYTKEISLAQALSLDEMMVYGSIATGKKYLINPSL